MSTSSITSTCAEESRSIGVCRTADGCVVATIRHADGSVTPIPHIVRHQSPERAQRVEGSKRREESWLGTAASDLALSILTALVGSEMADVHYQDFKWLFIATKSGNGFTIPVKDIFAWLAAQSDSDPDGDHACEDLKAPARPERALSKVEGRVEGSISYQEDY